MQDIVQRLGEVQEKLNAPKNQWNKFGKYPYRNCEDILQGVKPLLGDAVILISDEVKVFANRIYIEATATFKVGAEEISVKALAREPESQKGMSESQVTGSTSSYARKYALSGLLLIDDNKDADSRDNSSNGSAYVLTDMDKQWIEAVKQDAQVLEQIQDPEYKKLIKKEAGI